MILRFGINRVALKSAALLLVLATAGCAELNDPYYSGSRNGGYGGYNDPYGSDDRWRYEQGRRDAEREAEERRREERHEWRERERDRQRAEDERRRYEELRAQQEAQRQYQQHQQQQQQQQERCPSGFHETSRKCSDDERRHGCKDIKTPSGLRCINR